MEKKHKIIILAVSIVIIVVTSVVISLSFISTNPSFNTQKLSQFDTGGDAIDVVVVDDIAYVVDITEDDPGGLVIINVSDPASPYELGSYYQTGRFQSVDVAGDIAYIANVQVGLEIINVSNPSNPIKIGQYTGSGEIAYIADWSRGFIILNVSVPSIVIEIARFTTAGACTHVSVLNDLAVISDHLSQFTSIRIINVVDPYNPVLVGYHVDYDADFWNPFLYEDIVYMGNHGIGGGEVLILDVSVPSDIVQLGLHDDGGFVNSIYVNGSIAYMADYNKGLKVFDVSDPSNPTSLAQHFDGGHAIEVFVVDDIAYVANRGSGLQIIKLLM